MPKNLLCSVVYESSMDKSYIFRTMFTDLKPGDLVVVNATNGVGVCVFTSYVPSSERASKWVVAKVDMQAYQASQGISKHFCKVCGELLSDVHAVCPSCSIAVSSRNDAIMLIGDDDDSLNTGGDE